MTECAKKIEIIKPKSDDREFEYMVLENGLTLLTISHPESEVSAASLKVEAGNFQNPKDVAGLAHFLEHMIFMGTKKYPDEKDFSEFISKNCGTSNAYTENTSTTFYFEIPSNQFSLALDRFSQFFIRPLLKEDGVQRELNAVNSEFEKNLTVDEWRFRQILKEMSYPTNHPFCKFTTGNRDTLNLPNIRDKVREFFEKHYSSNLMFLCIYGDKSTKELQDLGIKYFSEIKNLNLKKPSYPGSFFHVPSMRFKITQYIPVREQRTLGLYFPLEYSYENYKEDQTLLIGHILGHEASGSFFDVFKKKGWLTSFTAGRYYRWEGLIIYGAVMSMTIEGEKHVEELVKTFFEYVAFMSTIKDEELQRLYEECYDLGLVQFHWRDRVRPSQLCPALTFAMMNYQPQDLLIASYVQFTFDSKKFRETIKKLFAAENMFASWLSKSNAPKSEEEEKLIEEHLKFKTEKYYKGKYRIVDFPKDLVDYCTKTTISENFKVPEYFVIPQKNEFIPKNLDLLKFPNEGEKKRNHFPRKVFETDRIQLWYKQDTQFDRPKSSLNLRFHFSSAISSNYNFILQSIFSALVVDYLNSITYYAEVVALNFTMYGDKYGHLLGCSGWNDSVFRLCKLLIHTVTNFSDHFKKDRFDVIKEEYLRRYKNYDVAAPITLGMYMSTFAMNGTPEWWYEDCISCVEKAKFEDVVEYYKKAMFSSGLRLEGLVIGNSNEQFIMNEFVKNLLLNNEKLTSPQVYLEKDFTKRKVASLEDGSTTIISKLSKNVMDKNSCLVYTFDCGLRSEKVDLTTALLSLVLVSDVFDILRTKQQLGYIVGFRFLNFHNAYYAQFYVQSSDYDPVEICKRVEKFVHDFYYDGFEEPQKDEEKEEEPKKEEEKKKKMLYLEEKLSEKFYNEQMEVLKQKYKEKLKRLGEEVSNCWEEIWAKTCRFSRREDYVKLVENRAISRQDVFEFYKKHFLSEDRKIFQVRVFSKEAWDNVYLKNKDLWVNDEKNKIAYTEDLDYFKKKGEYYPDFVQF